MSKKDQNDLEIAQLLEQLKEKATSDAAEASEKKEKKAKYVTDDDVKALLRKYYSDTDTVEKGSESSFDLDTSEFLEENIEEEASVEPEEETESEEEIEPEEETEPEEEIDPEEETEPEEEIDPEEEIEPEEETELEEEPEEDEILAEIEDEERLHVEMFEDSDSDAENLFSFDDELYEEAISENENAVITQNDGEAAIEDEDVLLEDADNEGELPYIVDEPCVESDTKSEESLEETQEDIGVEEDTEKSEEAKETDEEWKPLAKEAKIDDSDLELMIALGFGDKLRTKYGNDRVRNAEEKMRVRSDKDTSDSSAFGYRGREYTQKSDVKKINSDFNKDALLLVIQFIGTLLFAGLLFILENIQVFGIKTEGIFNSVEDPTGHALASMLLLSVCAAISYKRIWNGLLVAFGRSKSGNPIIPLVLTVFFIYDTVIAIAAPKDGVVLYGFAAALAMLLDILADIMDFGRTKMTFNALKTNNPDELYGLCDLHKNESGESMAVATKIPFAEGFFKNMNVKRENAFLLVVMIPLAAVGAIAAVAIAIFGKGIARSLSAFPAVFAFAAPIGSLFVNSWQKLCVTVSLLGKKSGLIGELSEEQVNIDFAVFDDETVFPSESTKILNIRFYNNAEIYKTLYNVNALFEGVGGPLRDIMKYTSSDLGAPSSVEVVSASEHFVEALIDGKTSVCAGSALALSKRGITVQQDPQDAKDSQSAVVMYAAVNREVSARFCIEYSIDADFLRESAKLAVDGVGIKVKTLDPNIDKAMLLFAFGEDIPTSIIREPKSKECLETGSVTSVFARGEAKNLVTPLVMGRRIKRVEKAMGTATIVEMSIGVFVSVALLLIGVPGTLLPGAATAVQLLMLIPSVMVYLLGMSTSSRKKDKKTER